MKTSDEILQQQTQVTHEQKEDSSTESKSPLNLPPESLKSESDASTQSLLKQVVKWFILLIVIGLVLFQIGLLSHGIWVIYWHVLEKPDMVAKLYLEAIFNHFAATIGLPFAVIGSLCLVLLLRYSSGPIEFEGLGFKFRGGAGELVFWLLCFLALTAGIKLLW